MTVGPDRKEFAGNKQPLVCSVPTRCDRWGLMGWLVQKSGLSYPLVRVRHA